MFDSVPPNLPVEPTATPTTPTPMPAAPPATPPITPPPTMMSTGGKKEPEDIFSGLDQASGVKNGVPNLEATPPHAFPVKLVAIIGIVVVALAVIGGSVYFFVLKPSAVSAPTATVPSAAPAPTKPIGIPATNPPVIEQPPAAAQPTPVVPPPTATSPTSPTNTEPVTQPPAGINLPPPTSVAPTQPPVVVVTEGKDTDSDQLTDAEEPYYNADMTKADTDGDGFSDGAEVMSLYDPSVKGGTLDNASFMSHPTWGGLTFLLPKPWSILPVAGDVNQARIATGSATRFNVTMIQNPNKRSFDAVVAEDEGAVMSGGVVVGKHLTTKRGYQAIQSGDGLTTYIAIGDKVLSVKYDLNGDTSYDDRTSYAMVVQSILLTPVK